MALDTAVTNIPPCVVPTCFTPPPATPPPPPSAPLLSITKTHDGNFVSGGQGVYTLTVCNNVAAGPTIGTVSVVDTLPEGLTGFSMVGAGWVCDVGTLTCTRSDALAPGACFPPITLTVSVA